MLLGIEVSKGIATHRLRTSVLAHSEGTHASEHLSVNISTEEIKR